MIVRPSPAASCNWTTSDAFTAFGWPGFSKMNLWRQDKGQKACAAAFTTAIRDGGLAPIPLAVIFEVSRVTIELASSEA